MQRGDVSKLAAKLKPQIVLQGLVGEATEGMSSIASARNFTPSSQRDCRETWYHPDKRGEGNPS
jgi:hypothetical protein